jgi:type IV pilus assembly protein PilE
MKPTGGSRRGLQSGFTLAELMVTVIIASVLLAIAVPSYTSQIRKSRRTDAKRALLDLASREERFLSLNNAYSQNQNDLGYSTSATAITSLSVGNGYYTITVPAPTAGAPAAGGAAAVIPAFTATATAVGTQAKDTQCATFTVDSTGKQSSTDSGGGDSSSVCWN